MMKVRFMMIVTILIATATLQSCLNDDNKPNDSLVISTINVLHPDSKEFDLTLDNGEKMLPANGSNWGSKEFEDGQRAFILFNELEEPAKGYDHHIVIKQITEVLTKEIISMGEEGYDEEKVGNDKINATYMWISKDRKYLTVEFQYYGTHNTDKKHFLNLVIPSTETAANRAENEDDGYLLLDFRHNSEGDSPQTLGEGYVSFKLNKIATEMAGKKGLKIRVNTLYNGTTTYKIDFT